MERVGGVAAVRGGIGERADDLQELDDRTGPAVGEHQREGVGVRRARVDEVDGNRIVATAAQLGAELRERVEPLFGGAEVVAVAPVGAELLGVRERQALRPVVDGLGFRPTRAGEPIAEVGDRVSSDLDPELGDLAGHAPGD